MDENSVREIARQVVDYYELRTGEPRHKENTRKIDNLFTSFNQMVGAVKAIGFLGSALGVLLVCLEIYGLTKGHR